MRLCLIILGLIFTTSVNGQNAIDLFTISGFYGLPSSYEAPLNGKATESGSLLNLKIPIILNEKTIWYNDVTHTYYSINSNLDPEPVSYLTSLSLQSFIFQTGIVHKLNEKNGFQLLAVPRYNNDLIGSHRNNWQLGGIALYEHRQNEKVLWRFGVLYNGELFGPLLVPLVYLDWQVNERLNMAGLLPINFRINYKVNDRLNAGFNHFGLITTYRIGQREFESDYIERTSIDESLYLRWRIMGRFHLEGRLGYSLGRFYKQYNQDQKMDLRLSIVSFGDERAQKNVSFSGGPIASVRLVYNLILD